MKKILFSELVTLILAEEAMLLVVPLAVAATVPRWAFYLVTGLAVSNWAFDLNSHHWVLNCFG